ncbi:MCE family protein [Nocardioides sp. BGMRC 2183]|nr:MCE family protein [Nocardioides sp. BGMRC 2183]
MLGRILGDRLYQSVLGIALVLALAVAYIFAEVLDQPLTESTARISVELEQTGGLFEGSAVTYRGVRVGKVREIEPTGDGVLARIELTSGTDIPADSLAMVRSLSPVGEQYLDFQPEDEGGPFLADGDVVQAESTDLPQSLSSTVIAVNEVLRQVDHKKLKKVLGELSTGLAGTGDDIGHILDQGTTLLETLDAVWPETERLIRNGDDALSIITGEADSLRVLGSSAKKFAAFLRDYDPQLRRTLKRGPGQMQSMIDLVEDAEEVLPGFLDVGVSFTDIFMSYEPHLRALLQSYAPGLQALLGTVRDNELRIAMIPDRDPRCEYSTSRQDPRDTERRPLTTDGRCDASFRTLQRGSAHAPGPVR